MDGKNSQIETSGKFLFIKLTGVSDYNTRVKYSEKI